MADRNPLPWFKYDPQVLNEELDGLSDAQQGAYHRLIRRLWTRGPLPESELARLAGESWAAIQPLFAAQCDAFSVAWLEVSRESARRTVEQRSLAGRSSAVQRPLKYRSTKAKRQPNGSEATVERSISLSSSTSPSTSDSSSEGVQGEARKGPNPDVQGLLDYATQRLTETDTGVIAEDAKDRRFAANSIILTMRKRWPDLDALANAKALIDAALADDFHRKHAMKLRYLLKNLDTIRLAAKERRTNPKTQTPDDRKQQLAESLAESFAKRRAEAAALESIANRGADVPNH